MLPGFRGCSERGDLGYVMLGEYSPTVLGTFDSEANFITGSMSLEGILGCVSEWSGHR